MSNEECKALVPISGDATIDRVIEAKALILRSFEQQVSEDNTLRELQDFIGVGKGNVHTVQEILRREKGIRLLIEYRRLLLDEHRFRINTLSSVSTDIRIREGSHEALLNQIAELEAKIRRLVSDGRKRN